MIMKVHELVVALFGLMLSDNLQCLVMTHPAMIIPPEIRRIMSRVNSLKSFKKLMNIKDIPVYFSPLGRSSLLARGQGVELENQECKPYPVIVPVPQPQHHSGFTFPLYIKLHRCAGACNSKPRISHCAVQATSIVKLRTYQITWRNGRYISETVAIAITNHTRCHCQCVTRPWDCHPQTQVWDEDNCRCVCKPGPNYCPRYHAWDPIYCKCRCEAMQPQSCRRRMVWDQKRCQCVCKKRKCRYGKYRNSRCRCVCPKRKCPAGLILNSRCECQSTLLSIKTH